jgi:hypothetical protein
MIIVITVIKISHVSLQQLFLTAGMYSLSRCLAITTRIQVETRGLRAGIYEECRSDSLRGNKTDTKFHTDWVLQDGHLDVIGKTI